MKPVYRAHFGAQLFRFGALVALGLLCVPTRAQTTPSGAPTRAAVAQSDSAQQNHAGAAKEEPTQRPPVVIKNIYTPSLGGTKGDVAGGGESAWKSIWEATTAIGSMVLVLVTGGLALYTRRLWTSTHGMLAAATEQSAVMERSVREASRSASAMSSVAESMAANVEFLRQTVAINKGIADRQKLISTLQSRPYVFPTSIGSLWRRIDGVNPAQYEWQIRVAWTNYGSLPTSNLVICTTAALRDGPLPPDFNFPYDQGHCTVGGVLLPHTPLNSASLPWNEQLSPEQIEAVRKGEKLLYVWGWAKYKDRIDGDTQYVTRFCWLVTVVGDPTTFVPGSDRPDNRLEFRWSTWRFGNCADEECGPE